MARSHHARLIAMKKALAGLESDLKRMVFGQDEAISALSSATAFRPVCVSLKSRRQLFVQWPHRCRQTEVARQLAESLGIKLIRFDMSEYMEQHSVSRRSVRRVMSALIRVVCSPMLSIRHRMLSCCSMRLKRRILIFSICSCR